MWSLAVEAPVFHIGVPGFNSQFWCLTLPSHGCTLGEEAGDDDSDTWASAICGENWIV